MAQYQITIDKKLLYQLFSNDHVLASLVQEILNQILQAQVAEHLGTGHYQRTETRQGYRNGCRLRMFKTRVGRLTLQVPKVREGHFSTELFACYQRSEQALLATLMEMVIVERHFVLTRESQIKLSENPGLSRAAQSETHIVSALPCPTGTFVSIHLKG